MATAQLAREVLAAPPAMRLEVFNAVVEAAKSARTCDYTELFPEYPWLTIALTHQSLISLGFKSDRLENMAIELLGFESPGGPAWRPV